MLFVFYSSIKALAHKIYCAFRANCNEAVFATSALYKGECSFKKFYIFTLKRNVKDFLVPPIISLHEKATVDYRPQWLLGHLYLIFFT